MRKAKKLAEERGEIKKRSVFLRGGEGPRPWGGGVAEAEHVGPSWDTTSKNSGKKEAWNEEKAKYVSSPICRKREEKGA